MNEHLTKPDIELANMQAATIPGMAHWAGSGPPGKTCGACWHLVQVSRGLGNSTRCEKYTAMMNGRVGPKKIPRTTAACKYFEQVPEARKP